MSSRPTSRYGSYETPDSEGSGNAGKIIAATMVLLVVVIAVFGVRYYQAKQTQPLKISIVSYNKVGDNTMRVVTDVHRRDVNKPGYCIVYSRDDMGSEAGRREVVMKPGGEDMTRLSVDIPSKDAPVSAAVYGCSDKVPSFLDSNNPVYTIK